MFPVLVWVAAILAGAFLVAHWDEVIKVAGDFINQIASKWDLYVQDILDGAWESVMQRLQEDMAVVAQRFYFQDKEGNTYRESICEKIPESEVPAELMAKLKKQPVVDVKERMQQELVLEN